MAGVKGAGGPVPKRSDRRLGHRAKAEAEAVEQAEGASDVEVPPSNGQWHPVAKRWFESLAASGQAVFYQPSDWATAYLVAESISRELKPQIVGWNDAGDPIRRHVPPKGASLAAWLKAMSSLMVTEGDRRRLRLELMRPLAKEAPGVSWIDDARSRLRGDAAG
jgi:hypothetical protein